MVDALTAELALRLNYLDGETINTIYFGGGTPSLLRNNEIELILSSIFNHYNVEGDAEITLEGNPDDLTINKLEELKAVGINRLSIGIQSFENDYLSFMNRAHNANEGINSVKNAQKAGINNISIDLMYGLPSSSISNWKKELKTALSLDVPHISAYCLTIEKKTVFGNRMAQNKLALPDEESTASQFEVMVDTLESHNYQHYEVSNFCLPEKYSIHNSNYWKMQKYLGIGPGAHSYDLRSRQFNIKNNHHYMKAITLNKIPCERELLSNLDQANDYLLTSLRTIWGCDLSWMKNKFNIDLEERYSSQLANYVASDLLIRSGEILTLTTKGKLLADQIAASLYLVD